MPKRIVALTDTEIRKAKPKDKSYKLYDGGGLFLLVTPTGGKLWRLKYSFGGTEKLLALGIEDRTGRATKLISRIQLPSNLNSDSFIIDGETVYVCTNYSANDCIANVKYLFEKVTGGINGAGILLANS